MPTPKENNFKFKDIFNFQLQLEENKKIHVTLMNKLESLWTRMELSKEEQQLFMEGSVGYSDTTIVSIKHEVQ